MLDPTTGFSFEQFRSRPAEHARRLRRTGRPAVLTLGGRTRVIVQDAASYRRLLERLDRAEAIAGIRRGLESADRGEGEPARKALDRIRRRRRISRAA